MVKEEHRIVQSPPGSTAVCALHCLVGTSKEAESETRTTRILEIGLETNKVAKESVQREVVVRLSKASIKVVGSTGGARGSLGNGLGYFPGAKGCVTPSDTTNAWVHL